MVDPSSYLERLAAPWSYANTPFFVRESNPQPSPGTRDTGRLPRPTVQHFWTGETIFVEPTPRDRWSHNGYTIYEGPSRIDGKPIFCVASAFYEDSENIKTGAMIQTWIMRADMSPQDAIWSREDFSICGDCEHRGRVVQAKGRRMVEKKFRPSKTRKGTRVHIPGSGRPAAKRVLGPKSEGRSCYVVIAHAPRKKYVQWHDGQFPGIAEQWLPGLFRGASPLRIGSYGDPTAVPEEIWRKALTYQHAWTGYTSQWRRPENQGYKDFLMASVMNPKDKALAESMGWRTFRVGRKDQPLIAGTEIICPGVPEGAPLKLDPETGRVVATVRKCDACGLCAGQGRASALSIVVPPHGGGARHHEERGNPGHDHPHNRSPVSRQEVESELAELYRLSGYQGPPLVSWPNELTRLHERNQRRYAQVYAPPGPPEFAGADVPRFEFAEQTRWLPRYHRLGLEAHEIGHALSPEGGETGADQAALEQLGVEVTYDDRWPGKGLQRGRRVNPPQEAWWGPDLEPVMVIGQTWTESEWYWDVLFSDGEAGTVIASELHDEHGRAWRVPAPLLHPDRRAWTNPHARVR